MGERVSGPAQAMEPRPTSPDTPRTIAAIDIGSNSVRMVLAQVLPDGRVEFLERTQRPVRLGQDTFVLGRLSQAAMNAAAGILRDYRRILDTYRVEDVRTVATSAVREAANADAFVDRIAMTAGLDVEVIEPTEESRLTVGAVLAAVGEGHALGRRDALIVDVGGGSTLLTLVKRGQIAASGSHRLGSIRLQERLATSEEPAERAADLVRHEVSVSVAAIRSSMPLATVASFIAVGGDARLVAREIGEPVAGDDLHRVDRKAFDRFVEALVGYPAEKLARRFCVPFADAETLVPALLTYQGLLHETRAKELLVSNVSMRDGLVQDLARRVRGEEDPALVAGVLQSACNVGEKYGYDAAHSHHVADLAVRFFDALQREHGLGRRHRLLLRVAGLLHDVGAYVSNRAHHKHSYYLVSNSEIFALRRDELALVAHLCRYHRKATPKPTHLEYMSLPRETRIVVSKLAAVLRVADALDRGHAQVIRDLEEEKSGDEFTIYVRGVADLALERRAVAAKADLFEEIYGLRVRLEKAERQAPDARRARSVP